MTTDKNDGNGTKGEPHAGDQPLTETTDEADERWLEPPTRAQIGKWFRTDGDGKPIEPDNPDGYRFTGDDPALIEHREKVIDVLADHFDELQQGCSLHYHAEDGTVAWEVDNSLYKADGYFTDTLPVLLAATPDGFAAAWVGEIDKIYDRDQMDEATLERIRGHLAGWQAAIDRIATELKPDDEGTENAAAAARRYATARSRDGRQAEPVSIPAKWRR